MVRFIIDLEYNIDNAKINLHSNMVRFIIHMIIFGLPNHLKFTFQYG